MFSNTFYPDRHTYMIEFPRYQAAVGFVNGSSTDIGAVRPSPRLESLFVKVLAVRNGLYCWDLDYITDGGLLDLHVYAIGRVLYVSIKSTIAKAVPIVGMRRYGYSLRHSSRHESP